METGWQPIETAPRDGTEVLCWRKDWGRPLLLCWKENPRLVSALVREANGLDFAAYFGDPAELDDYDFARAANAPTHWMPLPPPPSSTG